MAVRFRTKPQPKACMMRVLPTFLAAGLIVAYALPATAAVALGAPAAAAPKAGAAKAKAGLGGGGVAADVRCLLTMVAFTQDKTKAQAGQVGVFFFGGRLSAEAPGLDLGAAMRAEAPKLTPATLPDELKRCGAVVGAFSQKLQGALGGLRPAGAPPPAAAPAPAPMAAPAAPAPK